ncbi:hypothetical protein AB1Y20_014587 [Prymnesium parvum]|uniref:HNH endonuclease n=1 Tax=Prymnesium parvum TaxID=97485 RepID=A0AB34ICQ9_PRYPA
MRRTNDNPLITTKGGRTTAFTTTRVVPPPAVRAKPTKPLLKDYPRTTAGRSEYDSAMSSFNDELQKYKDERAAFKDAPLAPRTVHTQIVANPNHVDDVHADVTRVFCEHAGIVFENQGLGKLALQLAHPSRDNIPEKTYQRIYDEQEAKCSLCERDILRKTTEPGDMRRCELDHRIPLHAGGTNCRANLHYLCGDG